MFQMPFDDIIDKICSASGKPKQEILEKVNRKVEELNNLVTKEGAAHIIANEYGVKLLESLDKKDLQLKNLLPGLRNVNVVGRVSRKFPITEWEKGDKKGKVGSFVINDNTGTARVVLWNDKTDILDKEINQDTIVRVTYAFVKEGNYGPEIHLRDKSEIEINPEGVEIQKPEKKKLKISEIEPEMWATFRAAIVDFAKRDPFFEVCPKCGKRVRQEEDFECKQHGKIEPKYSAALNLVLDDGTGNIKGVLFGNTVESFLGMSIQEFREKNFEEVMTKYLGKERIFSGKSGLNSFSGETEFTVRDVEKVIPANESKLIIEELDI